jgi:hypothetical protein
MMKIGKLGIVALFAVSGCAVDPRVSIRASALSPVQVDKPVPQRLADARAQLALANVALALDLFRKAEREQPGSTEALEGMADCYERMGRNDLARRYFEQALALEPRNSRLLGSFADMLERQGQFTQAASVRSELRWRAGDAAPKLQRNVVTMRIPESSVELTGGMTPVGGAARTQSAPPLRDGDRSSRLQRLSLGEVALVTKGRPTWARVRTPLEMQSKIRLLNATSEPGLAARTRSSLLRSGWGQVVTGNSTTVRERSLILYPSEQIAVARKLSRELALPMARDPRPGQVTILLGRDAARTRRLASL